MVKQVKKLFSACKQVYTQKAYFGITFVSSALLFSFNALFRNRQLLENNFSWKLAYTLILGMGTSFTQLSLTLLILSCLLAGVVVAFSVFLVKRQVSNGAENATFGLPAIIMSILVPACSSCALGLFGLLGIGSILAFLPLQGLEFSILTSIIIFISLLYLAKKINSSACEMP